MDAPNKPNPPSHQIQIRIDESKMVTTYANTIRSAHTADELVLDFGLNLPAQGGGPNQPVQAVFSVGSRVVMNWAGAKRLMLSLQQAVAGYEQHFGPIELVPGGGGGGNPPGAGRS